MWGWTCIRDDVPASVADVLIIYAHSPPLLLLVLVLVLCRRLDLVVLVDVRTAATLHTSWGSVSAEAEREGYWRCENRGVCSVAGALSGLSGGKHGPGQWAPRMGTGMVGYGEGGRGSKRLRGIDRRACVVLRSEASTIE